ncbi:hypothetical protein A2X44_04315 [candidate division CPR3 bacterium GWF2_35_18]|uniref:Nudix hydrolase domain-containing protein n=1 Tax=candidate division CPR3 bacterium GW2011_GWF2_35_18 TaxID=1618350 RepID=A0A0G0BIU3_UNCC3|nr:MAG: hypothetical protein UR67_C0007G0053 [candidate division CPR3 bacterium GW2011_GWF2_35_18]KKP86947.1 MAG: hypothetical protein UR87_C0007G0009 [candidate division CPR3 bacterium GW2011_GWE2_35_7]OGB62579.1 MAG: hypothetical protein A2X44_04315 [candidate division CPR3 bacterium GWF2_35_18]OGB65830.1 MAG: hypothetical protein A2250_01565 [candidate division CPR3 bacterium RIFOXYA2_FULL_35_13]OGB79197.1 MAG: hypothetical protein A2296_04170 [candidate division CPR3 bacterium RIFOXYB2_FULL
MSQVFPAVKAIIHNKDKFLVIKQVVGDKEFWDLPGGKIEYGETPHECLQREVKEETGLEIKIGKVLGIWWFFRTDQNQVVCTTFLCLTQNYKVDFSINPTKEPIQEFRWVSQKEFLTDKYYVSNQSLKELIKTL